VDHLIRAFTGTGGADGHRELVVAGYPTSEELADRVRTLAADDPRVTLDLRFLPDADLVATITGAQLVVLPYPEMHNSGAVLAALSLDRPVLVPDNEVNRELADEVGRDWLLLYTGGLSAKTLEAALTDVEHQQTAAPALDGRGWEQTGQAHLAAYRRAVTLLRSRD
jgi:glycosyltransferase involved in cell wall biosynthesis